LPRQLDQSQLASLAVMHPRHSFFKLRWRAQQTRQLQASYSSKSAGSGQVTPFTRSIPRPRTPSVSARLSTRSFTRSFDEPRAHVVTRRDAGSAGRRRKFLREKILVRRERVPT